MNFIFRKCFFLQEAIISAAFGVHKNRPVLPTMFTHNVALAVSGQPTDFGQRLWRRILIISDPFSTIVLSSPPPHNIFSIVRIYIRLERLKHQFDPRYLELPV
jgi:hypothetical protein